MTIRVGLVDIDRTKWRNRDLMKAASYYESLGYEVLFPYDANRHGQVHILRISTVFTRNQTKVFKLLDDLRIKYPTRQPEQSLTDYLIDVDMELPPNVLIGGTGWNIHKKQAPEIYNSPMKYSLYNALHGAANYTQDHATEGCPRGCDFCVVPEMSGSVVKEVRSFAEIHAGNPQAEYIRLMDDNFLAAPKDFIRENLKWAIEHNVPFSLTQGADIRFIHDDDIPELLARAPFRNVAGTKRFITFAFDSPKIEKQYRRGIERVFKAGIHPKEVQSFVLTGFDSTPEEDLQRLEILRGLGVYPYVMVYEPIHGEIVPEFYFENPDILAVYGQHLTLEEQYYRHWKRCRVMQRYTNGRQAWAVCPSFDRFTDWQQLQRRWSEEDKAGIRRNELPQKKAMHKTAWGEDSKQLIWTFPNPILEPGDIAIK